MIAFNTLQQDSMFTKFFCIGYAFCLASLGAVTDTAFEAT